MLHAERLTCIVDDRPLFAALTLSLAAGELLQVAGDNGAGKTSLLRILCGLARPESGVVSWQGQPLAKVRESFHRQLLWLGHKPGVNAALTADENLRFFFPASRLQQRESALAAVGLAGYEDLPLSQLSAGQQRRVALTRLWLTDAPLWILDGPRRHGDGNPDPSPGAARPAGGMRHPHHPPAAAAAGLSVAHPAPRRRRWRRAMMRALLARELRLAWRSGAEILNPLWFFLIVITLFPFGVGAAPQLLAQIAPGVVWVVALLAALLVMDRLFRDDWQDGSLEQLMLLPTPLVAVVLVKVVAHWMMSGLPLLIVSPLAALLLGMSLHDAGVLALTLLLGTPTLSFLGAVGVGLTVGLKRGGVLLSLLVLPLAVPLLIFATAACQAAAAGLPVSGYLAMLAAFLTASATLCPFATAAALRLTVR
ncbi:heme exporter protein CcmB [Klebsiella pneumoniae subsp. rhinoscleromatis ATCC 13884]|nr:heme exporter protein CcmB [Klebsiella pneumoniae subsp. rhinoscleromatis ATCC 13884]STT66641.1 heme exporter permease component [Klebsiella pneumoniae]